MHIRGQIDGDFEGWTGDTVVKLVNGQAWQQATYHYNYAFMPAVEVAFVAGKAVMRVDGVKSAVPVTEVSIKCEGTIVSPFTGFQRGMLYQFDTGDAWQQVDATTESHHEAWPSAMVVNGLHGTVLKVDGIDTFVEVRPVASQ